MKDVHLNFRFILNLNLERARLNSFARFIRLIHFSSLLNRIICKCITSKLQALHFENIFEIV